MPHLSPMSWVLMIMFVWLFMSMIMSSMWWNSHNPIKKTLPMKQEKVLMNVWN
uniref:ATP synthase F0 subunit 8 n=1 Tax=Ozobranchus jantseanus TaxID=1955321 RepID=A0A343D0M5_9ANNE|nr:ATP synthase F0 subunit 8 [Ozobranchus jantseanus]ARR75364.1 ATP synthase F0 subunit 8 [Ozobranchus jantseanus]